MDVTDIGEIEDSPLVQDITCTFTGENSNYHADTPSSSRFSKSGAQASKELIVNPVLGQFFKELKTVLYDAENKIKTGVNGIYSDLSLNMSMEIQLEKDRHVTEKKALHQEIDQLRECIHSLESIIELRRSDIEMLAEKSQQQQHLTMCSKVFYSWRMYVQNKKRERFEEAMAVRHYERNLKRKAFSWWLAILNAGWKGRMELKAHLEVVEMQKRIVDLYEGRIRNLEDTLSSAGRTINTLQSNHKFPDPPSGPHLLDREHLNLNSLNFATDRTCGVSSRSSEKASMRIDLGSGLALCSNCTTHPEVRSFPRPTAGCFFQDNSNQEVPSPRQVKPMPWLSTPFLASGLSHPQERAIPKLSKSKEQEVIYHQRATEARHSGISSSKSSPIQKKNV